MMNLIFQNKSANFVHHWKVVDKKDLYDTYKNLHDYKGK